MNRPQIPGFYFDEGRNKYFKIISTSLKNSGTERSNNTEKYSKEHLLKLEKTRELTRLDSLVRPKSDIALVHQYDINSRFRHETNLEMSAKRLKALEENIFMRRYKQIGGGVEYKKPISKIVYSKWADQLISMNDLLITRHKAEDIRQKEENRFTYNLETGSDVEEILALKLLPGDNSSDMLLAVRDKQLLNLQSMTMYKIDENGNFPQLFCFDLKGFNSLGDITMTADQIAYTSYSSIELFDIRRQHNNIRYQGIEGEDFLTLDLQQTSRGEIFGAGSRSGKIYFVDRRVPHRNFSMEHASIIHDTGSAICNLKFLDWENNQFVTCGVANKMSLFDVRNMKTPVVEYSQFHNEYDLKIEFEIKDGCIMVKDTLLNKIKVYNFYEANPVLEIGGCDDGGKVYKFAGMKQREVCIVNSNDSKLEYWTIP